MILNKHKFHSVVDMTDLAELITTQEAVNSLGFILQGVSK